MAELSLGRPVTASKSRACREGHTSGPCRWLFLAARPVGDVKSLKALHRYNVVKTPAVGVVAVWKWPAAFKTIKRYLQSAVTNRRSGRYGNTSGVSPSRSFRCTLR